MLNEEKSRFAGKTKLMKNTRLRLTLSFLLGLLAFAFSDFGSGYITEVFKSDNIPVSNDIHIHHEYKLTTEEKKMHLEYLLSGYSRVLESEKDFTANETGTIICDTTVFGGGVYVAYSRSGTDKPGYILKGIVKKFYTFDSRNKWLNDTMHNWYVVPRIRIKPNLIYPIVMGYNDQNFHTPVCRLEIVNTEGKVVHETEYEAMHFMEEDPGGKGKVYYSGGYMEGFGYLFDDTPGNKTKLNGKEINPGGLADVTNSKLDYRIYWYGYTDIWIDRITVENELAVELMEDKYVFWFPSLAQTGLEDIGYLSTDPARMKYYGYLFNKAYQNGIVIN